MNQVAAATCKVCGSIKLVVDLIQISDYYICRQCAKDHIPNDYQFLDFSIINKPKRIITR